MAREREEWQRKMDLEREKMDLEREEARKEREMLWALVKKRG